MQGDLVTPWRVVVVAKDLNALVHQPVVNALCPAPDAKLFPQGIRTAWLKPGRCLWQWWAYDDAGTHWSRQKGFVDQAAALKCDYYLVDEGWEHSRQEWFPEGEPLKAWDRMQELCTYAKAKGVGIWAWRAYNLKPEKQWPGLETHEKRLDFFRRCKVAGIAGVKIDFMDSESHDLLEFYQDCLRIAADNQIMINFHGANKPAGEIRTWPNEMGREGIRGLEYNKFGKVRPSHYATLPFTGLVAGHGDFTPTTFQSAMMKGTTAAQQLASAIVLSSPLLCWADKPDLYLVSPAVDVIRSMPVEWDETIVLAPSRIGELAAFARRHGDEWWVAAVNGGGARSVELPMEFLGDGTWKADLYADGDNPEMMTVTKAVDLSAAAPQRVELAAGGGVTMRIYKTASPVTF
jgi:alpha-glucosidase